LARLACCSCARNATFSNTNSSLTGSPPLLGPHPGAACSSCRPHSLPGPAAHSPARGSRWHACTAAPRAAGVFRTADVVRRGQGCMTKGRCLCRAKAAAAAWKQMARMYSSSIRCA
jgi:hypothetical protein